MATTLLDAGPATPAAAEPRPAPPRAPSEAVAGSRSHRLAPVARSVAVAALVGLLLGSQGLVTWAEALPVGPLADRVLAAAQAWDETMAALGLTRFGDAAESLLIGLRGSR